MANNKRKLVTALSRQLLAAFPIQPVPLAGKLLRGNYGERDERQAARRAFAGKLWTEIDSEFLLNDHHWASYYKLSPVAYGYYLPALLANCLSDFRAKNPLIHTVVYSLLPDFWSICYRGQDRSFRHRVARLNNLQYDTVCSFLGLVFEFIPRCKLVSAQALRWGWNRNPLHPASVANRKFYHALHNYAYPAEPERKRAALIAQIRVAFDGMARPGNVVDETQSRPGDDEPALYLLEFRGLDWRRIHPLFLAWQDSLSFFDNERFRYYLPAYLIADIQTNLPDSDSNCDPVSHLTRGLVKVDWDDRMKSMLEIIEAVGLPAETLENLRAGMQRNKEFAEKFDGEAHARERFADFSRAERAAIIAYLRHRAEGDKYHREEIDQALNNYWIKSVL